MKASPDAAAEAEKTPAAASKRTRRPRSQQSDKGQRKINEYSRDELISVLLKGMGKKWWTRDDAIRTAAHRLGFQRTGSQIRDAFKSAITGAIRRGLLKSDGKLIGRVYDRTRN